MPEPDHTAAAIHRFLANKHYDEAERFRKLGLVRSARAALEAARHEDRTAEILENPSRPDPWAPLGSERP